ncbi:50S ribosomal protein L28 [Anthocerotibacter panamensis]|uniref:50S ribosomal protein L28 n=1 Tax=Anthocerotibacter panamensis TaxID=2857077 RepID=UPI001C405C3E|nr:50S ribosomal protein L28 [Anthocerotibacter panamensis]
MSRRCTITGKKANNGYAVSHSHRRTKKLQQPNLQYKKLWDPEQGCFVRLKVSTQTLRTIQKNGINQVAREYGINLAEYITVD